MPITHEVYSKQSHRHSLPLVEINSLYFNALSLDVLRRSMSIFGTVKEDREYKTTRGSH